jgi:hypothetical protein
MKGHAIVYNIGASAYVNPIATFEYPYYYRVIASIGAKYCTHIIIIIWDKAPKENRGMQINSNILTPGFVSLLISTYYV